MYVSNQISYAALVGSLVIIALFSKLIGLWLLFFTIGYLFVTD